MMAWSRISFGMVYSNKYNNMHESGLFEEKCVLILKSEYTPLICYHWNMCLCQVAY